MSNSEEPLSKRPRLPSSEEKAETLLHSTADAASDKDDKHETLAILNPKIIHGLDEIAKIYREAKPYSHAVLDPIFVDGFAGMYVPTMFGIFGESSSSLCLFGINRGFFSN